MKTPTCPACSHGFCSKGTRIMYDRDFLMQCRNSPLAKNPPPNLPKIPGVTVGTSPQDGQRSYGRWMPLLLQCGHTYCDTCLGKIGRQLKTHVTCPACQAETPLKERMVVCDHYILMWYTMGLVALNRKHSSDIDNIKLGSLVNPAILQKPKSDRPGKLEKSCCECPRAATCWCMKCEVNMCGLCFDKVHRSVNALKGHQCLPLAEDSSHVPTTCSLHDNRPIEYFCDDDEVPICSHCVIVGEHHGHAITAMEERNKTILEEMGPALSDAKFVLRHLQRSDKILQSVIPEMKTGLGEAVELLSAQFSTLHSALQAREVALVEELVQAFKEEALPLEEKRLTLLEDIQKLSESIQEAQKIVSTHNLQVVNAQQVLIKLNEAKKKPCFFSKDNCQTDPPRFKLEEQDNLKKLISESGKVEGGNLVKLNLLQLDDVPEELREIEDSDSITTGTSSIVCNSREPSEAGDSQGKSETDSVSASSGICLQSSSQPRAIKKTRVNFVKAEMVYVTHIKHPGHFMVQKCSDADRQKQVSRQINKYANGTEARKRRPTSLAVDDLVLAQYSLDMNWYRGRVKQVFYEDNPNVQIPSITQAEVFYLDYGNSEVVHLTRMTAMLKRFTSTPALALQCALVDIVPAGENGVWSMESIETFARMTGDKPMVLNVSTGDKPLVLNVYTQSNNLYQVDLSKPPVDDIPDDRPLSLRDALVFMEMACFTSPASVPAFPGGPVLYPVRKFLKPDVALPGEFMEIMVSHVNSPHSFYVQSLGEEARYLTNLMVDIQKIYGADKTDLYSVFCPQKYMVCAAQFSHDENWYRALVVELPGRRNVVVQYVDYGNTELLPYWKLKKLLDCFMVLPGQGIHCQLADVEPVNKEEGWSKQALEFMALFNAQSLVITIQAEDKAGVVRPFIQGLDDDKLTVVMHDTSTNQDICINTLLVQQGFAVSTGPGSAPPDVIQVEMPSLVEDSTVSSITVQSDGTGHTSSSLSSTASSKSPTPEAKPTSNQPTAKKMKDRPDSGHTKPPHIEVLVSHVMSPVDFSVQVASAIDGPDGLDSFMSSLQDHYKGTGTSPLSIQAGDYCVACFSRDHHWYRATVIRMTDENKAEVLMVDYGYRDILPVSGLRDLDEAFMKRSAYSLRCQFVEMQPAGGINWTKTACEFLKETLEKKMCYLVEKGEPLEGVPAPVDLLMENFIPGDALNPNRVEFTSVRGMMIDKGLALPKKRTRLPNTGNDALAIPPKPAAATRPSIPACTTVHDLERSVSVDETKDNVIATSAKNCVVQSVSLDSTGTMGTDSIIDKAETKHAKANQVPLQEVETKAGQVPLQEVETKAGQVPLPEVDFDSLPSMTGGAAWADLVLAEEGSDISGNTSNGATGPNVSSTVIHKNPSPSHTPIPAASSSDSEHSVSAGVAKNTQKMSDRTHPAKSKSSPVNVQHDSAELTSTRTAPQITAKSMSPAHKASEALGSADVVKDNRQYVQSIGADGATKVPMDTREDEARPQPVNSNGEPVVQPVEPENKLGGSTVPFYSQVFPPPDLPEKKSFKVIPTYVDYSGHVFVQELKDDESMEGRFGFLLKERTLETIIQEYYLANIGRYRARIPRDGNCLFRCFAQGIFGDQSQQQEIRKTTVRMLKDRWCEYQNTIGGDRDVYLREMAKSGTYGGEPEIQAMCMAYEVRACVYMGGLDYPVQQRVYCENFRSTIELIYISDGQHDGGHYDLIVSNIREAEVAESIYQGWRWTYIAELRSVAENADYTSYDDSLLGQLMEKLLQHYINTNAKEDISWEVGQGVIAYYSDDGQYYRSRITEIGPRGVKVLHVDFGDSEWVTPDKLRPNIILGEIPQQCQDCVLVDLMPMSTDGKWPTKVLEYMHSLVVGKEVIVHVQELPVLGHPLKSQITLDDGRDLSMVLCDLKMAYHVSEKLNGIGAAMGLEAEPVAAADAAAAAADAAASSMRTKIQFPERKVASPYMELAVPEPGGQMYVTVTHLNSPNQMYVQNIHVEQTDGNPHLFAINQQLEAVTRILEELANDADTYPEMSRYKPGLPCVAKYTVDDGWYRGEIIDVLLDPPLTFLAVLFVDYGTQEFLTPNRVRAIPEDLITLAAQSHRVQVAGLCPPDGSATWLPETKEIVEQVVSNRQLLLVVKSLDPEVNVDLYDLGECLSGQVGEPIFETLAQAGLCKLLPLSEDGTIVEEVTEIDAEESQGTKNTEPQEAKDQSLSDSKEVDSLGIKESEIDSVGKASTPV